MRDAMQDSPVLMRFHSPRVDDQNQAGASSPTTPRRPISSSSTKSQIDPRISLGSPTSARSERFDSARHQRPRPASLQFRTSPNLHGIAPRGRTPQVRRSRRRSWEKDSLGSARSIIEEDERDLDENRQKSSIDARSELDKRRSLTGRGMGMGPRRTAPMTLVER